MARRDGTETDRRGSRNLPGIRHDLDRPYGQRHSRDVGVDSLPGTGDCLVSARAVCPIMAPSPGWSRALTVISGGALAVLGLAIVLGWHIHSRAILQPWPGLIAPVYNTALSFFLSGLGLLALTTGRRLAATVCGGVVLVLGGLNVVEHGTGLDLGI